jgi:hypothetical protein
MKATATAILAINYAKGSLIENLFPNNELIEIPLRPKPILGVAH